MLDHLQKRHPVDYKEKKKLRELTEQKDRQKLTMEEPYSQVKV